MLSELMNTPCVIISRTNSDDVDDYGDATTEETTSSAVCEFQQVASSETGDEVAATTWRIFLPADTAIDRDDAVVVDGHTYELVEEPNIHRNPRTQADSHIEALVRRVSGADDIGS